MSRGMSGWRRLGGPGVLVLLLLGTRFAHPAAPQKGGAAREEDSVRDAETARAQALLHADTTALSRLVADEFVEVSRLGALRSKGDNLRDIASGQLKLTSVKYDSTTVRIQTPIP